MKGLELFVFGLTAIVGCLIGRMVGYFKIEEFENAPFLKFRDLFFPFSIYILFGYFATAIFSKYLNLYATLIATSLSSLFFILGYLYLFAKERTPLIWKYKKTSISRNLSIGFFSLLIAFPITFFLSQIFEILIYKGTPVPDQVVVLLLKFAINDPLNLTAMVVLIIVLAPFIEELLFRGLLQNYIKQFLGRSGSILITSIVFAAIHFEKNQGLGNINTFLSTFILSIFLGHIYEKQGSLVSPIALHSSFNTLNLIYLLIFKDF